MLSRRLCVAAIAALGINGVTNAQDKDVAEGAALYVAHCKMCHGDNSPASKKAAADRTQWRYADAASTQALPTRTDLPIQLAFAPPFGPNLRGIVGRPAGTAANYEYSKPFLKALTGLTWDEGTIDWWIRDTQAWVPGSVMVYKQGDSEVRRKIIAYLKANP
ncbi:MAG TPA: c-type cytochrome [Burkholderiales bacterium]|nr:c-type cytochrome [Burkholderiales bacterium]